MLVPQGSGLSSPASSTKEYTARVMVETIVDGVPRRVHVWVWGDETRVSFPRNMSEDEAALVVDRGLALLKPLDVPALFREPQRRPKRHIETE